MLLLTGFSFGGVLATCVAAKLWCKALDSQLLKRNLCCITFGQPIITVSTVAAVANTFPDLNSILHLVYDKEDTFPGLMHHHAVGCTLDGMRFAIRQHEEHASSSPDRQVTVSTVLLG